jgi:hypothetical protein
MTISSILQYHESTFKTNGVLSKSEFVQWIKFFTLSTIVDGLSIGNKFCQDFQLTDFMLMYVLDNNQSIKYIKQHYLVD